MIMYYQTKFGSKRISSSKDTVEIVSFFIIRALAVTLTWKITSHSFCMTLWLMMMHHNTKFSNKVFGSFRRYHLDRR